ncbi:uncharacterized protein LOC111266648 isoform X2 [Varroa jacobsoni]|uniref:Uncharacterized protein n=1 Tax=Varroa destructor TaxID=109461 RepID=A0A7M7J4R7_VARDE|nr:uncharacterized protein LOC111244244 isoform X2 [Varroa destructor]XP_022700044.1 uncharacterized protein LOC111266648 isoform X2 [Varroa jacobsoni]
MDKATRAIRRSGVRLKSINSGHTDLALVISGIRDMRIGLKSFQNAQTAVSQDMMVWSHTDENRAIQDVMEQINELHIFWADSQKNFLDQLKSFKHDFEMILEGERQVDAARGKLAQAEQREYKIKKELKKAVKKASVEELNSLETKLTDAERAKDLAQFDAVEKMQENEACKLIRLKEGLSKLSESYLEMAHKMAIIFEAQREVTQAIPDVHTTALHEMKYTGGGATKRAVQKAKDRLDRYHSFKYKLVAHGTVEPPPPYTPGYFASEAGMPYEHDLASNDVRLRPARVMSMEPQAPPLDDETVLRDQREYLRVQRDRERAARRYSSEDEEQQRLGAHKL